MIAYILNKEPEQPVGDSFKTRFSEERATLKKRFYR